MTIIALGLHTTASDDAGARGSPFSGSRPDIVIDLDFFLPSDFCFRTVFVLSLNSRAGLSKRLLACNSDFGVLGRLPRDNSSDMEEHEHDHSTTTSTDVEKDGYVNGFEELNHGPDHPFQERTAAEQLDGGAVEKTVTVKSANPSVNNVKAIPNGGLRAWMQVLGAFFLFFNSWFVRSSHCAWFGLT